MFDGKNIVITGGTGSFGHSFIEMLLTRYSPRRIVVFSRDEFKQYKMEQKFSNRGPLRFFIGDVRDKDRLYRAFADVDYVIHAAALKHVPATEYNPFEAVKTNIYGAQNVIDAAIDMGVKKVIALSTDKAASPVNLYGATKLCSDKLFVAANSYAGTSGTSFSVVRYGNVVASRGSVIPFFKEKRKEGVLPITDPRMTRFWITLEQGVEFVMNCMEKMVGGETFVPKLPSMNILDLAKAIGPECRTEVVGIRPGEKLHEVMVPRDQAVNTVDFGDYYVIKPAFNFFGSRFDDGGSTPVPEDFEYNSRDNEHWLTIDELREMLEGM